MPGRPASTSRSERWRPPQLGVDVPEAGGHARQAAFPAEGAFGHVDGGGERAGEGPEARVLGAGRGKLEQPVLGLFDPAGGGQFEVAVIGPR